MPNNIKRAIQRACILLFYQPRQYINTPMKQADIQKDTAKDIDFDLHSTYTHAKTIRRNRWYSKCNQMIQ